MGRRFRISGVAITVILHAAAATGETFPIRPTCRAFIADAARTAGLPDPWIAAVMRAESGGDPNAVSFAGAQGCMQIMPSTWRDLQGRGIAGPDPFDARANMLAGAIYLRTMHDRFGWPDALAAYHAGAGRFENYLATGRRLPSATLVYVDRISSWLGGVRPATIVSPAVGHLRPWTEAPIFIVSNTPRQSADRNQLGPSAPVPFAGDVDEFPFEETGKSARSPIFVVSRP
ncbi:lytic transglycosylase domain-containing protein [Sphingosinicellaceae bacterium]|nr:lytic transglycosylase domain-containing protein [Sphingosinicellaceae bacterium]